MRIKPVHSIVETILKKPEAFNAFKDFSKNKRPKKLNASHTETTVESPNKVDVRV